MWPRRRTIMVAVAALLLLPIEASDAGFLSDLFRGSSKQAQPPKRAAASPRPARVAKPASPRQRARAAAIAKPAAKASVATPFGPACDPAKFRIVVDVGHTPESE